MAIAKVARDRSMCIGVIVLVINIDMAKLRVYVITVLTKMADMLNQITFLRVEA